MTRLKPIVDKLAASQAAFLHAADTVPAAQWLAPPLPDCWSAGELVAHVCQVERGVLAYADRVIRKHPLPVTFLQRFHLPIALVQSRIVKRKSPVQMDPATLQGKETMIAGLRGIRERTLAFLEETHGRDLGAYFWRHPFLGHLDFYNWFTFIAAHQIRHTKQMWEITKNLPKDVATSQK